MRHNSVYGKKATKTANANARRQLEDKIDRREREFIASLEQGKQRHEEELSQKREDRKKTINQQ